MGAVLTGLRCGLLEFFYAPINLWSLHKQINGVSSLTSRNQRTRASHLIPLLHDQAQRRLQLSAAIGEVKYSPKYAMSKSTQGNNHAPSGRSPESSSDILSLLGRIWSINVFIVVSMWASFHTLSVISNCMLGRMLWEFLAVRCICGLITLFLHNFIFLAMELVNTIYLKKIYEKITSRQQYQILRSSIRYDVGVGSAVLEGGSSKCHREPSLARILNNCSTSSLSSYAFSQSSYGVGRQLMDCIYSILFFIIYRLQWKLCTTFKSFFLINFIINSTSLAFTYACYAFEYYARQTSDVTFEVLLSQVVSCWPFFVGYGLPLGVTVSLLPSFFGWSDLLVAFWYPIMVVGAFQVHWTRALDPNSHRMPTFLRSTLILSMKPAFFMTNTIISVFVSILGAFCAPFRSLSKGKRAVDTRVTRRHSHTNRVQNT